MKIFGSDARRWRKPRIRAVDPIVATILMVAISVVLAAVLYVLIAGLTHGPGGAPIGSAFTAGHPMGSTCIAGSAKTLGAVAITGGCTPGDFIYTLTIESSSVSFGSVLFEVKTGSGMVFTDGSASSSFAVLDIVGHVTAISPTGVPIAMTSKWSGYGLTSTVPTYSDSTPLTSVNTIVIDRGSPIPTTGQGLTFVAIGTGSFSGTTAPISLP